MTAFRFVAGVILGIILLVVLLPKLPSGVVLFLVMFGLFAGLRWIWVAGKQSDRLDEAKSWKKSQRDAKILRDYERRAKP